MRQYRAFTSRRGCSVAETYKLKEKDYEYFLKYYSEKLFKKKYEDLSNLEKEEVHFTIIESSGRSNKEFDEVANKNEKNGKALFVLSAAHSCAVILFSSDIKKEICRHVSSFFGAIAGGTVAERLAPFLCRPGDPSSVKTTVFAGSIAGSLSAESIVNSCDEELEGSENGKSRRVLQPGADR